MLLDRHMLLIINGSEDARTVKFPNSTRQVWKGAFADIETLRTVILNEGLKMLGGGSVLKENLDEAFANSCLTHIVFSSTL